MKTSVVHRILALVIGVAAALTAVQPAGASTLGDPSTDPFYRYTGSAPLESIEPGTVLKSRALPYHLVGLPIPIRAVQLLYRSTGARGQATTNATTVLRPLLGGRGDRVISYHSFYDTLNPADQPSTVIAGGRSFGGMIATAETGLVAPFLLTGYTVAVTDTEGPKAEIAAGPEYGTYALDGLRAALASPDAHITDDAEIGMLGYSGGAIATDWAAELAPGYAPELADHFVGAAMGGVLVNPVRNLHYIDGSLIWSGVMPMALIGLARAYDVDLTPYLSERGAQLNTKLQKATIAQVLGAYPGLTFADLTKPQFHEPESIPELVRIANQLIMGRSGTPPMPLFIGQGRGGQLEGTRGSQAGIGPGDGVMVAGDVRTLARSYCDRGVDVLYREYPLSHVTAAATWAPQAYAWLAARFAGRDVPQNCDSIAPGNPVEPLPMP